MTHVANRMLVVFLMTFAVVATATAAGPEPAYADNGFNPRMLDASAPTAERLRLFAQMMALANQGQVPAQDLAGTLYWQGPVIDGSPVPQDLAQARTLLGNAAVHGDVIAMAKLAELELGAGQAAQAMVWAQMYARYQNPQVMQRARRGRGSAYASNLIGRAADAGIKIDDAIRTDVAAMVSRYDTSIRRGIAAFYAERRSGPTHLVKRPSGIDTVEARNVSGVAEYIVEFEASGVPGKIWLLDSLPDGGIDTIVRHYLDNVRATTVGRDAAPRYIKVSIVHNALKSRMLRPAD